MNILSHHALGDKQAGCGIDNIDGWKKVRRGFVRGLALWGLSGKFRQAIDNSQPYLISDLHLHHLGGQALTNPMGVL